MGAGAWGTALASAACQHADTVLWARDPQLVQGMIATQRNERYLPGITLAAQLRFTDNFDTAVTHALSGPKSGLIILGTPIAGLRQMCSQLALKLAPHQARQSQLAGVVWTCKGLEPDTGYLPHEIAMQAFETTPDIATGVLSGPSFAKEVASGLPVALTVASKSAALRAVTIDGLHGAAVRVYASEDVIGVEVGGALKNIIAIACGIADGLGLGTNARAALITRGLAEMSRFGCALGATANTFAGLTGLGDLVLTATGDLSRNRQVGIAIGKGHTLQDILQQGMTAEGARCALAVKQRAEKIGLNLPITEAVCAVLFDGVTPQDAVVRLLSREATHE